MDLEDLAGPARAVVSGATLGQNNKLARMAREYGYSGLAGEAPNGQSAAALFDPVDVRRLAVKPGHRGYAQGGGVN
jgi:hypothetical protein